MGGESVKDLPTLRGLSEDWTDLRYGSLQSTEGTESPRAPEGLDCRIFPNPTTGTTEDIAPIQIEEAPIEPSFQGLNFSFGKDMDEGEKAEHERLKQQLQQKRQSLVKRADKLEEFRRKIAEYRPGNHLYPAGGRTKHDYQIPKATTFLVVGPMGAGKSTLINNMIRVLNGKKQGFDMAQVLDQQGENGTFLLEEYNVCEESGKIVVFDSRGLPSMDSEEGRAIVRNWIVKGVRHGQKVVRKSDSSGERENLDARARQGLHKLSEKRQVNFVILAVSAVSLHCILERNDEMAIRNLKRLCTNPFLSFKDDRPVVVMTHGDRLKAEDRIEAQILLGKILGVSPVDYVFDIAGYTRRTVEDEGKADSTEDMALLEMLEFALYRADKNLPYKPNVFYATAVQLSSMADDFLDGWRYMDNTLKVAVVLLVVAWLMCAVALLILQKMKVSRGGGDYFGSCKFRF